MRETYRSAFPMARDFVVLVVVWLVFLSLPFGGGRLLNIRAERLT